MVSIKDKAKKVSNASFSLKDIALVWWHRSCDDVKWESDPITIWDKSKGEPKKEFYPKDDENDIKAKLRPLQHEEGQIWEYIREF